MTYETVVKAVGGPAIVEAVRAMDAGAAPEAILRDLYASRLPPALRAAYHLLLEQGAVSGPEVAAALDVLPAIACNRLKELERRRLAIVAGRASIPGGGAIKVYSPAGRESKEEAVAQCAARYTRPRRPRKARRPRRK